MKKGFLPVHLMHCSLQNCVQDTLSPIDIKLRFAQNESEQATSILNIDSATRVDTEVWK